MMDRMMDGMMWPMSVLWLSWLLTVIVLVLAAAALGKHLFQQQGGKRDKD